MSRVSCPTRLPWKLFFVLIVSLPLFFKSFGHIKRPWERAVQQWIMDLKNVVSKLPPEREIVIELLASIVDDVLKSRVQ